MAFVLSSLGSAYALLTTPSPLLLGLPPIDIVGSLRLCVAMRQIRAMQAGSSAAGAGKGSWMRNVWATWVVVWGGETILCALLAHTPSFLASPLNPAIFAAADSLVFLLPVDPPTAPSLPIDLPLSVLDAFTRVGLLTMFALRPVLDHPSPAVSESPLALLLVATILANGGFFIVSATSMLGPGEWKLSTPPELRPYGWMSMDLWSAGVVTALYAVMTRPQAWWADVGDWVGLEGGVEEGTARMVCLVVLIGLFASRAVYNCTRPSVKVKTE